MVPGTDDAWRLVDTPQGPHLLQKPRHGANGRLFAEGLRWCGRWQNEGADILPMVQNWNRRLTRPLTDDETRRLALNLERCRARWRARDAHGTGAGWQNLAYAARQSELGTKGGLASGRARRARADAEAEILRPKIRQDLADGLSLRQSAERHGISKSKAHRMVSHEATREEYRESKPLLENATRLACKRHGGRADGEDKIAQIRRARPAAPRVQIRHAPRLDGLAQTLARLTAMLEGGKAGGEPVPRSDGGEPVPRSDGGEPVPRSDGGEPVPRSDGAGENLDKAGAGKQTGKGAADGAARGVRPQRRPARPADHPRAAGNPQRTTPTSESAAKGGVTAGETPTRTDGDGRRADGAKPQGGRASPPANPPHRCARTP